MSEQAPIHRDAAFPVTRWSVVIRAAAPSPDSHDALASLCHDYWRPLYCFARRRGHRPEDAQDLTQGFILSLLTANSIATADQTRGRFRTFLLSAFCHYLAKEHRAQSAQKRGGAVAFVEMDAPEVEMQFVAGLRDHVTPELEFDRSWAMAVLESVMVRLRQEYETAGRLALFEAIQPHLSGAAGRPGYGEIGALLGMGENAVTVAMHRMRKRYGQLLREAISSTVATPADVDGELRHLLEIIARSASQ